MGAGLLDRSPLDGPVANHMHQPIPRRGVHHGDSHDTQPSSPHRRPDTRPDRDESLRAAARRGRDLSGRVWIVVAAVDTASARLRFATDVSAFGTHADVVVGRDNLEAEQWSQVWPAIEDFRFITDELQALISPDRLLAVAVVGWTSIGIAEDGQRFARPGRATLVLRRESIDEPWLGIHTHFSLGRDVPQSTHRVRSPIG